ncbi:guanylate cyclase [Elysia marginata]|uniref:guanylate cyclase n=1 Tax=Elysia marginata TaxID=1093978 RepID=A0AAV4FB92_9GAST|nr:guanylate cyclase [Elysia marginata]
MLWMRDSLINSNVVRFYGLTDLHDGKYVIEDFCSKGTVLDVLQNGKYNLNTDFKMSVALEIASGMSFLHVNSIVHGMLRSTCCWLDNKWTVKVRPENDPYSGQSSLCIRDMTQSVFSLLAGGQIGDWEYFKLLSVQNPKSNPLQTLRSKGVTGDKYELLFR